MAAHRYWRAVAMEAYGSSDLELSCFRLLDAAGARVDAPATLTASTAPATGVLTSLQDDDLTTVARWDRRSVSALTLIWDFGGSPADVVTPELSGPSYSRFLGCCGVHYSDDGVAWVEAFTVAGVVWPEDGLTSTTTIRGAWSYTDMGTNCAVVGYPDVLRVYAASIQSGRGATPKSAGVYQFEVLIQPNHSGTLAVGVMTREASVMSSLATGAGSFGFASNAYKHLAGIQTGYGSAYTVGDVIGVVVDFGVGSLTFYKNGVSQGVASATGVLGLTLYPAASCVSSPATTASFSLIESNLTYPVAGATPWGAPFKSILRNKVSKAFQADLITVGTGPVIIYGIPQLNAPVNLTVESGAVKDYTTGVLGTGRGRVTGTVKEKGTPNAPVYRKVRLIRERDSMLIREVWSHPITGAYSFDYVDELQTFTVLAYDHTGAFRAVVADRIVPELIP